MRDLRHSSLVVPDREQSEHSFRMEDVSSIPTPGKVLVDIGRVVVVCLGLGLLARVMIMVVGV